MVRWTHDTTWTSQSFFSGSPSCRAAGAGPKHGARSSNFRSSSRLSGIIIAIFMPLMTKHFFVKAQIFLRHLAPGENRERGFARPVRLFVKSPQIGCD